MASKKGNQPRQVQMIRHFAVITILLTATIAIFADGERRDAIGAEIKSQQERTALVEAERTRNAATRPAPLARSAGSGGFGSDDVSNPEFDEGSVSVAMGTGGSARAGGEDYGRIVMPPPRAGAQGSLANGMPAGLDRSRSGGATSYGDKKKAYTPTAEERARLERAAASPTNRDAT